MNRFWWYELRLAASFLTAGGAAGWLAGHVATGFYGAFLAYGAWQAYRLTAFLRWLQRGRLHDPPALPGVWGELCYLVYRHHDRALRKRRRLGELLQRYQATAAALPDAAVVLDRDQGIQWFNEAASQLLHLRSRSDVGQRIDNLLRHPDFVAYLHGGNYTEPLVLNSLVEEGRVLQIHIVPYGQDQRLLVARDITRMHRLEVMRRDFVANVSHELRTPLAVISGYLETLLEHGKGSIAETDAGGALAAMKQQADRMMRLIEDLLTIARLETGEGQGADRPVDVPALLRSLEKEARALNRDTGHAIELAVDEGLWLRGNARDLYSAFLNLVSNAIQYTPPGGHVTLSWHRHGDEARFCVTDDGIGIPAPAIPRLTERFYRVDPGRSRAAGGTGLGLAIVKHVLNCHDGELHIQSTPGRGSTFCCIFPAARVLPPQGRAQAGGQDGDNGVGPACHENLTKPSRE